jgi:hypothetical protein
LFLQGRRCPDAKVQGSVVWRLKGDTRSAPHSFAAQGRPTKGSNEPHRSRRETVITFSDEDDTATIQTHQRRIITRLKNNPAASQLEDISF